MSSVRMCDKCKRVFSELEEGWQTGTMTTRRKDEHGIWQNEVIALDACNRCSFQSGEDQTTIKALTVQDDVP